MVNQTNSKVKILFYEIQKFKQWWLWLPLILFNLFFWVGIYMQIIKGIPYGSKPMSNNALLLSTILFAFFTLLFTQLKLETIIKEDGICIRFFPFHLKFKCFQWSNISKAYLLKYSPISDFGGWGVRLKKNYTAYSVSGNMGLHIELHNGRKILIGTNKPDELMNVLQRLGYVSAVQIEN